MVSFESQKARLVGLARLYGQKSWASALKESTITPLLTRLESLIGAANHEGDGLVLQAAEPFAVQIRFLKTFIKENRDFKKKEVLH